MRRLWAMSTQEMSGGGGLGFGGTLRLDEAARQEMAEKAEKCFRRRRPGGAAPTLALTQTLTLKLVLTLTLDLALTLTL